MCIRDRDAVLDRHRSKRVDPARQDQLALTYGDLTLHPLLALLETMDARITLRNRELRLLEIFFNSPDIILSKEQLTDRLFPISEVVTDNAIEVYVGRLRKKLANSQVEIETVRGIGYRLRANA